jgi:hypothetical protein
MYPPMKEKLCSKEHDWDVETINSIDWDGHQHALHNLIKHKSTLVKYLNDILPIGKMVHQYDPKYPAHCPSCPAIIEDRNHFWTCPAANRNKWRKECLSNMLKTINDLDTATPIQGLLLDVFDALIYGKPLDTIPIDPTVMDVAEAQAEVGWHQILKGRFVKQWSLAHDKYLGSRSTKQQNGGTWITKVITAWFQQWLDLWKIRNEDRHGRDEATKRQAKDRQTIREIIQFYKHHDTRVDPTHQWHFNIPIQERMQGNISSQRIWLNTWKPVIEKSYTTNLETGYHMSAPFPSFILPPLQPNL